MDNAYITEVARVVISILKDNGNYRKADNLNPEGMLTEELLEKLAEHGHPISAPVYYNDVRPMCIELGYSVVANGTGQYIGHKDEWVRNPYNSYLQIVGRTKNQKKNIINASESMNLEDGNKYAKTNFGLGLGQMAVLFKTVGEITGDKTLPFPKEIHIYLLESDIDESDTD